MTIDVKDFIVVNNGVNEKLPLHTLSKDVQKKMRVLVAAFNKLEDKVVTGVFPRIVRGIKRDRIKDKIHALLDKHK